MLNIFEMLVLPPTGMAYSLGPIGKRAGAGTATTEGACSDVGGVPR